ncbi:hypothetical protein EDC04DRAFT_2797678 [Pisolithus marmoratus]|nr:hypothetical protein EDC04DRAFT_2797678 [Pisolithus marmoratus]
MLVAVFQKPRVPEMSTTSAPSAFHVDNPDVAAVFGHQGSVQSTANHYSTSRLAPHSSDAGSAAPAHVISPVVPDQVNAYSPPFGGDANAAAAFRGSGGTPATADMVGLPLGASRVHPFPLQFMNPATKEPPKVSSRSSGDLRPCGWKKHQGGVCDELVGWDCKDHLASAHGIVKISSTKRVKCGVCGEEKKRKYILRHFREKHLRFPRSKRKSA